MRGQVKLSLRVASPPKMLDRMVSGAPVSCRLSHGCTKGPHCLLKANLIGTGRKRKCSPKVFKDSLIFEGCHFVKAIIGADWVISGVSVDALVFSFDGQYTKDTIYKKIERLGLEVVDEEKKNISTTTSKLELPTDVPSCEMTAFSVIELKILFRLIQETFHNIPLS